MRDFQGYRTKEGDSKLREPGRIFPLSNIVSSKYKGVGDI